MNHFLEAANRLIRQHLLRMLVAGISAGALVAAHAQASSETPSLTDAFARSAWIGMQLSVKRGHKNGRMSDQGYACVQALEPSALYEVMNRILRSGLSPSELDDAEAFFASPSGRKYARYGQLLVYRNAGETAPEPPPQFTAADEAEVEHFARTPAGAALFTRKVTELPGAKEALRSRIFELLKQCATQGKTASGTV